jgi:hypothetical protein
MRLKPPFKTTVHKSRGATRVTGSTAKTQSRQLSEMEAKKTAKAVKKQGKG